MKIPQNCQDELTGVGLKKRLARAIKPTSVSPSTVPDPVKELPQENPDRFTAYGWIVSLGVV